jgi:hypothetical protein
MPKTAQGCAICTFTLPTGRRCGAIALRGRAFCYHHDRSPRRIAQDTLDIKLARYRRELESMDLPRLLEALLEKLDLLQAILPGYPEARLILGVASCRLAVLLSNYFSDAPAPPPESDPYRILTQEELEAFADSLIRAQTQHASAKHSGINKIHWQLTY